MPPDSTRKCRCGPLLRPQGLLLFPEVCGRSRAPGRVWEGEAFILDRTRSRGILAPWGRGCFIASAHTPAAVRLASGGEDVGVMSQPVQQGSGQLLIPEDLDPFTEAWWSPKWSAARSGRKAG